LHGITPVKGIQPSVFVVRYRVYPGKRRNKRTGICTSTLSQVKDSFNRILSIGSTFFTGNFTFIDLYYAALGWNLAGRTSGFVITASNSQKAQGIEGVRQTRRVCEPRCAAPGPERAAMGGHAEPRKARSGVCTGYAQIAWKNLCKSKITTVFRGMDACKKRGLIARIK
jgi:hypothetical protein